jgi:hypothetical protein
MKNFFLSIFFLFQVIGISYSQPTLMWSQTYNGPPDNADEAVSVAVDAAGNSYVTGSAFAVNGTLDMVTIKYDPLGQQLWLHNFNGSANTNDQATKLVLDNAGNVYVTGYTSNANSVQDITTIKYNTNGVLQWVQFYDGAFSGADAGNALCVDGSGNVYVTGYETTAGFTMDYVTLKYNSAGMLQWFQTYNGPGSFNDEAKDIGLDVNGNVYVLGTSDTVFNAQPNEDIVLMKYNNAGIFQWRRVYDSPTHGYEFSKKLAIDKNNNILVAGYAFVTGQGFNFFTFKWDSSGVFKWLTMYNFAPNTFEQPNAIITDSLNNVIVVGQGIAPSSGSTNDYVTVKYDSSGTQLWSARYNNIFHGEDRAEDVAMDDSLNIYVTGYSKGTGTGFDIATIKYDPAGNQQYVLRYDNLSANGDDVGNAIAVRNGDIYITGKSSNLVNDDYVTLRYSYGTPLVVNENKITQGELAVFPNPAHGELNVVLPTANSMANKKIHAEILNSLGEKVLISESLTPETNNGNSFVTINTGDLPAGIYIVMIYSEGELIGVSKFVAE